MKRRTKVVKNSSNTGIRSLCSPTPTVSSPRWFQLEEGVVRVADGRGIEDLDSPTAATCLAFFQAIEVIESRGFAVKQAFAHHENEVALPQNLLRALSVTLTNSLDKFRASSI